MRAPGRRRRLRAGVLVLVGALICGCGSSTGRSAPAPAARATATPSPARAPAAKAAPTRASSPGAESATVRRLVALGRPIYCAGRRGNEVALTFDDGPGPYTRLVLAKLRKHHVHATFFVVARNLGLVAGATREERALGAVGDHTFTHPQLTALAPAQARGEIVGAQHAIERASHGKVFLFRPPYGARSAAIDAMVRAAGMLQILWNVDSRDSLGASYAQIEQIVRAGLHPGAILLMHENHGQTVRALLGVFAALRKRHLRAVSVPQLLTDDPPTAAQLRAGGGGCGISGALGGGH